MSLTAFRTSFSTASDLSAAKQALDMGAFRRALAMVDSAGLRASDQAEVHFIRGRILTELHRPDEAESAIRTAMQLDPTLAGVAFNLGNTAYRRQKYRVALSYYEKETAGPAVFIAKDRAYEGHGVPDSAEYA